MAGVGSGVCLLLRECAVVLSLLLMAGDVERNPGPTGKEGSDEVDKVLPSVDDSPLGGKALYDILKEMMPLVASWRAIGRGFRIDSGHLDQIHTDNHGDSRECLSGVLTCWLNKNYDVEQFGEPSWRMVVEVVAHSAAGNNCALAMRIAGRHSATSIGSHDLRAGSTTSDEGASVSPRPSSSTSTQTPTRQTSKQTPIRSREDSCASSTVSDDVFTSEGASVSPSSSSQSEASQKPPFGCGCGKCTFSSFIESGCPNPVPSVRTFPHLDLSGLTPEQKETLTSRLRFESKEIMFKFEHVKSVAMKSLIKRGVTVDDLLSHLTILETLHPVKKEPTSPNCYADLLNAQTISKVFIALSNYVSFFNYDIIDHIITELGTEEDKLELQKYKDDFRVYAKRKIYECLPQFGPASGTDHADIFVKVDSHYESYTVVELQDFKNKLSQLFHISSQGVLRLCGVEEDSAVGDSVDDRSTCTFTTDEQEDPLNKELEELGQSSEHHRTTELHRAARRRDLETVRLLMKEKHENPLQKDEKGDTALHAAARGGSLDVLKYFISEKNCNPACPGYHGRTPLHYASYEGHLEVVKYLVVEQQVDPLCKDENRSTPLHWSCATGDLKIVKFLMEEFEKYHPVKDIVAGLMKDKFEHSPLHYAVIHGHLNILQYFISEKNCSPNTPGKYGRTPLHSVAARGHLHIVKYLIDKQGCDPSCLDIQEVTPLHRAARNGHLDVIKYLTLKKHCNPDQRTILNSTPLHYAAEKGHLQVVQFFVEELKCPPNLRNRHNMTPHQYAKARGHLTVALYLKKIECSNVYSVCIHNIILHYII